MADARAEIIGVVGLWHLGCTIAGAWLQLGYDVVATDDDGAVVRRVARALLPVVEPGLPELFSAGLSRGRLRVTEDATTLATCSIVFLTEDTAVREDDTTDLTSVLREVERVAPYLADDAVVVASAQLPVGTAQTLRALLQAVNPSLELVYSPENLRLGEALERYLRPGQIVIGSASDGAAERVARLFASMDCPVVRMSLESAEMVKHVINSFLGTSVALANHWADTCAVVGADYEAVARAARGDPRIGRHAYLTPGLGFAGATLARDLKVLDEVNERLLEREAPLFGDVLRYNHLRVGRLVQHLLSRADLRDVTILGMTYKAGTSTLRGSSALVVAEELVHAGRHVRVHDPMADWSEMNASAQIAVARDAYDAATDADVVIILTEWPEYGALDLRRLAGQTRHPRLLDPKNVLRGRAAELSDAGFQVSWSIAIPEAWRDE